MAMGNDAEGTIKVGPRCLACDLDVGPEAMDTYGLSPEQGGWVDGPDHNQCNEMLGKPHYTAGGWSA